MSYDLSLQPGAAVDLEALLEGVEGVSGQGSSLRFSAEGLHMEIDQEGPELAHQISFHIPYAFWSKAKAPQYMALALPLARALGIPLIDAQLDEAVDRVDYHQHRAKRVGAVFPIGLELQGTRATVRGFYASYTWDLERMALIEVGPAVEIERPEPPITLADARIVHWVRSPCEKWLALSLNTKRIRILDAQGILRSEISRCGNVRALAFSDDGERLLSGSDNKSVKVWDCGSGKALATLKGHEEQVMGVAWISDGRVLSHSRWSMRVWDVASKRCERLMAATMGHEWLSWGPEDWRASPGFRAIRWDNDARMRLWRPGRAPLT